MQGKQQQRREEGTKRALVSSLLLVRVAADDHSHLPVLCHERGERLSRLLPLIMLRSHLIHVNDRLLVPRDEQRSDRVANLTECDVDTMLHEQSTHLDPLRS